MALTLETLNAGSREEAARMLDGLYEHSPWIAEAALAQRPFKSLPQLKHAMARIVADAGRQAQLALISLVSTPATFPGFSSPRQP